MGTSNASLYTCNFGLIISINDTNSTTPPTVHPGIGIDTNTGDSGFLDIYMEGNASGWIAVGFSAYREIGRVMLNCQIKSYIDNQRSACL